MADITRDSYQDSKNYSRLIFQRGRFAIDSEYNELQQIIEAREARALRNILGDVGAAKGTACQVGTDGVTANQVTIAAGIYTIRGCTIEVFNTVTIAGLTTPGGARQDTVWMSITESEIDSVADPNIAVVQLGETTRRRQFTVNFGVNEGSATPPADTAGEPWAGGTKYITLAHLYRSASAVVAANQIVDRRYSAQQSYAIQMANAFMQADSVTWDGTTLTFTNLVITFPQQSNVNNVLYSGNVSFTPADGDALGFDGSAGFQLRRNLAAQTAFGAADGVDAPMKATQLKAINALTPDVFLIAWRHGTDIVFRTGVVLHSGQATNSLARQPSSKAPSVGGAVPDAPQMVYADANGNARGVIDHIGYRLGHRLLELKEDWVGSFSGTLANVNPIPAFPRWGTAVSGTGVGASQVDPTSTYPTPMIALPFGQSNPSYTGLFTANKVIYVRSETMAVFEIDVLLTSLAGFWNVGVGFDQSVPFTSPSNDYNAIFTASEGAANWQVQTQAVAAITGPTDTGIPVVANQVVQLRVELHGSGSPYGACARFAINGVVKATLTTNLPTAQALFATAVGKSRDTTANRFLQVGGNSVVANRYVSAPGL